MADVSAVISPLPGGWERRGAGGASDVALLTADDYRHILAVLDAGERANTLGDFRRITLEAVEEHLGYQRATFILGSPPNADFSVREGSTHGLREVDLEEYFERWSGDDPFISRAATAQTRITGIAALSDLVDSLLPNHRLYLERFLLRQGSSQLSLWLNTGLPQHGYLSVIGRRSTDFGPRDHAVLLTLGPHLAHLLRGIMLAGRQAPKFEGLSSREAEVAGLVSLGCSNREIADHLRIREDTVKKHLWHVMRKLKVRNRTQLALLLL